MTRRRKPLALLDRRSPRRGTWILAWTLGVSLAAILGAGTAQAGHTLGFGNAGGGGDCWRVATPLLCRTTWQTQTHIVDLRLIDWYSDSQPGWDDNVQTACNKWHNFDLSGSNNDIRCHFDPSGASSVYIGDDVNGNHGLSQGVLAMTWNCPVTGPCVNTNSTLNIWISSVWLNKSSGNFNSLSQAEQSSTIAHEMGHTLGLWHHNTNSAYLMFNGAFPSNPPTGPIAGDYGAFPPCSGANTGWGVRCVFYFLD